MKKWHKISTLILIIVVTLTAVFWPPAVSVHSYDYMIMMQNLAKPPSRDNPVELINQRTESNKKYSLGGNSYAIEATTGAIHYKNDRSNERETWKEIDTTISNQGVVTTAPYDLQVYLDGLPGFHYVSKESGEFDVRIKEARLDSLNGIRAPPNTKVKPVIEGNTVTWYDYYPDVDVVLTAFNSGVSLNRIIKSPTAPLEYDVTVTEVEKGAAKLMPLKPATDAEGQLIKMEEKPSLDGRTETLKLEVIESIGEVKAIKYPILDATVVDVQVGAGGDDGRRFTGTGGFTAGQTSDLVGYWNNAYYYHMHSFHRFTGVTIAGTIDVSYVSVYGRNSVGTPLLKVHFVDEDNPAAPTSAAEFDADALTSGVDWDGAWNSGAWNNSPSLNTPVQELVDAYTIDTDAVMVQIKNDGGTLAKYNEWTAYETTGNVKGLKLYIEYTEGGGDPSIANTPSSKAFGVVAASSTYWSNGSEPSWDLTDGDAYFTVTNNGTISIDITIKGTNFTGGTGWTLVQGSPGENQVRLSAFKEGDGSGDNITFTTTEQALISALAASADIDWELKFETGTFTDGVEKTSTVTLTASAS